MGYGFYETRINKRDNEIKNFGVQYLWQIINIASSLQVTQTLTF